MIFSFVKVRKYWIEFEFWRKYFDYKKNDVGNKMISYRQILKLIGFATVFYSRRLD